ncbi:MAG: dihydrodipicolinate synthase family protein [Verrucomicrobiota bacterium]
MLAPLSGLVAAPFTPFKANGELALDIIPQLAKLLSKHNVGGAFICGTTGEGSSLSSPERRQIAESWRKAAPSDLKLTVHVGHLSAAESRSLARHAQDIGADAIAAIAPSFFKPAGAAELIAWCSEVAGAAPKLPFYYYHMPSMTGVNIPVREFLAGVNGQIPNLVGIKFTHEDLLDYADAHSFADGRYSLLFGRDEILLSGLRIGGAGAVGSTYNYAAPLFHRIIRAFRAGDFEAAGRDQAKAQEFISVMARFGGLPAGKAIMKLIGVDCGPVRLPLRTLTPAEETTLREGLDACGFFEFASRP